MSSEDRSPTERMDEEVVGSDVMSSSARSSPAVILDLGIGTGEISNSDDEFVKETKSSQNTTPESTATPTMTNKKVLVKKKSELTKTKSSLVSYDRDSDEETSDEDQSQEETASDIDENTNDNDVDSNAGGQVKTGVDIGSMHIDSNQLQNASSKRVDTIGEAPTAMESSPRSQGDRTPNHQVVFPEDSDIPIPPLPKKHCSTKVEKKFREYYENFKATGLDQNTRIQALKDFRNPSLYEKMISHLGIDEIGTNFPQELYDPHWWGPKSYYEELNQAQKLEMDRRDKERRERTKIGFTPGVKTQIGVGASNVSEPVVEKRKNRFDQ